MHACVEGLEQTSLAGLIRGGSQAVGLGSQQSKGKDRGKRTGWKAGAVVAMKGQEWEPIAPRRNV